MGGVSCKAGAIPCLMAQMTAVSPELCVHASLLRSIGAVIHFWQAEAVNAWVNYSSMLCNADDERTPALRRKLVGHVLSFCFAVRGAGGALGQAC